MEGLTARGVDPNARPEAPVAGCGKGGSLVAFFAAQTNEQTPARNLPRGKPRRMPQGVFTGTLFEALAEYPGVTYVQLSQEVLRKHAVKSLARSTPCSRATWTAWCFRAFPPRAWRNGP